MRLLAPGTALALREVTLPPPGPHEVTLRVEACGVCRTDLHVIDNELPDIHCPVTPDTRSSAWWWSAAPR